MLNKRTYTYEKVVNNIIRIIRKDGIKVNEMIPSERKMAEIFACNYHTVRKAVSIMIESGILEKQQGRGTYLKIPAHNLKTHKNEKLSLQPEKHLGLLIHLDEGNFHMKLMKIIYECAETRGYAISTLPIKDFDRESLLIPAVLKERGCKAILISCFFNDHDYPIFEEFIRTSPIPASLSIRVKGFEKLNFNKDNPEGLTARREMRFACEYFKAMNYDCIIFFTASINNQIFFSNAKMEEYIKFARQNNMKDNSICANKNFKDIDRIIKSMDALPGKRKAIICHDDDYALRLMTSLYKRGYSIPRDFALMGCNCIEESAYSEPPLSTLQFPFRYLADSMIDHAIRLSSDKSLPFRKVPPPEPEIRETCGGKNFFGKSLDSKIKQIIKKVVNEIN